MFSHSSSVTLTGAPPADGITQMLLVAMLPKSSLRTNWRLPETQAIRRPSGDQLQECASLSRARPRAVVAIHRSNQHRVSQARRRSIFRPATRPHPASPAGRRGTSTRGVPPSAGISSRPRSELNSSRCPSGDQRGIRAKPWPSAVIATGVPPPSTCRT